MTDQAVARRWVPVAALSFMAAAVLLPTLALLGFYQGGRAVAQLEATPQWRVENLTPGQTGTPEQNAGLAEIHRRLGDLARAKEHTDKAQWLARNSQR